MEVKNWKGTFLQSVLTRVRSVSCRHRSGTPEKSHLSSPMNSSISFSGNELQRAIFLFKFPTKRVQYWTSSRPRVQSLHENNKLYYFPTALAISALISSDECLSAFILHYNSIFQVILTWRWVPSYASLTYWPDPPMLIFLFKATSNLWKSRYAHL